MNEEMKLKSCPFCGGEGEIVKCGVVCDEAYVVSCKECKVRTRLEFVQKPKTDDVTNKTKEGYIKEARELAAEKWNRRSESKVKHGYWINTPPYSAMNSGWYKAQECSVCRAYFVSDGHTPYSNHPYCCECGAKMDGKESEESDR